jgi:hypothetical protein
LSAILAEPIKRVAKFEDAAAVRLHMLATIIRPNFARLDERQFRRAQGKRECAKHKQRIKKVLFHFCFLEIISLTPRFNAVNHERAQEKTV